MYKWVTACPNAGWRTQRACPQVAFSVSEEAPPHYSSYSTGSETAITMETPTRRPSEVLNSRQDNRRPSIYSTMDAMPHLEFYANANATGRIRRSRPSLETLRKAADVSHMLKNTKIIISKNSVGLLTEVE